VSAGDGVSAGNKVGVLLAGSDTDGVTVRVGEVFLFFRGFGVGVGRKKTLFNLSPNVSSRSSVARITPALIANAIAITKTKRSFLFTRQ
jgi:hypothetical protein